MCAMPSDIGVCNGAGNLLIVLVVEALSSLRTIVWHKGEHACVAVSTISYVAAEIQHSYNPGYRNYI